MRERVRTGVIGAYSGPAITLISVILLLAALHVAQAVLMPVALAILFAFLLAPLVKGLQRRGIRTFAAVIMVAVLAFSALGTLAWVIGVQLASVAADLPGYRSNIIKKIGDLRVAKKGTALEKVQQMAEDVAGAIRMPNEKGANSRPVPVTVESPALIPGLPTLLEVLAVSGFVIVLVIFMLLRQEELRHRLVQVVGHRRLAVTTKALDEAGQRVSRYLIRQSIVNATFGVAVTIGLLIIGVPYAILWGVLRANLRFIPYLGGWMAVLAPTLVSLAVFPGWIQSIFVVGWMIVLELTMYMALEPWFYGQGAGISEVALLIALAFWTWLWGPIGLILGTPLTICVAVLGKYIPGLRPLALLIGESPPPRPVPVFYQRLVGRDEPEAGRTAREYLDAHSREKLFDDVLIPALAWAKRDHEADVLTDEDKRFVLNATYRIAAGLPEEEPSHEDAHASKEDGMHHLGMPNGQAEGPRVCLIGWPARDTADEVALRLLALLIRPADCAVRVTSNRLLIGETLSIIERERPDVICVVALPPGGLGSTLHLVRRLRARMPETNIVVGRWAGGRSIEEWQDRLSASGVDQVGGTIAVTRAHIGEMLKTAPAQVQRL